MPVGRFVLDVHGEDAERTWPANDALCAALQIINHLQDCAKDYRDLNRVYLPLDALAAHGASVDMLAQEKSPAPLLAAIHALAERTDALLDQSRPFADLIGDVRLAMEVGAIQRLAETLTATLRRADPLQDKVYAGKAGFALNGALGATAVLLRRFTRRMSRLGRRAIEDSAR
jgi:phytoene/squalene synthetase